LAQRTAQHWSRPQLHYHHKLSKSFCNYIILRFFKKTKINKCEGKYWIFKNILFVKIKISKLFNYLTNTWKSCQGTTIVICNLFNYHTPMCE
jgi:hypothetical protein